MPAGPGRAAHEIEKIEVEDRVRVVHGKDLEPAFRFSGKLSTYRKIFSGKLDPIKALMTRQLKLSGDMKAIMRAPKAAQELVVCATQVDTVYPE